MERATDLYLPYAAWPEEDRVLWEAAFKSGLDRFDECGSAAHLAGPSRRMHRFAYRRFLAFLSACHPSLLALSPADRINREIIEEYVKWQPAGCGPKSIAIFLRSLRQILRHICPNQDWLWLLTIAKRVAAQAKRRPERNHLVTSEVLYRLGVELMDRAINNDKAAKKPYMTNALIFRDGLMIALLAVIPFRRRTLAALRIGKHLVRSNNLWELDIPAGDIKTRRPLDFPISVELSRRIDLYLSQFRNRFPGACSHDYLWASKKGCAITDGRIYISIATRTRHALGFRVSPQGFRRAAATLWSCRDPANVRGSKDLLGHLSFDTTERYYIMAQSRVAGRTFARAVDEKRKTAPVGGQRRDHPPSSNSARQRNM
jgi:integrase